MNQKTTNANSNSSHHHNVRPFEKYSFHLDQKNSPQLNQLLTTQIVKLGGKIDMFITKNTNVVVTSRPKNDKLNSLATSAATTTTPMKAITSNNVVDQHCSPISTTINNNAFSRGKLLLESSNLNNQIPQSLSSSTSSADILELARNFNIRIVRTQKLLDFCEKYLKENSRKSSKQQPTNLLNDSQQSSTPTSVTLRKLCPPFIKITDNSNKYRPTYKELPEWPEMNFEYQQESCPFFKAKPVLMSKQLNTNNNNNQSQQSIKSNVPTTNTTLYKQLNEKCTMLTTPILTTTGTATTPAANTPILMMNGKSISTNNNQTLINNNNGNNNLTQTTVNKVAENRKRKNFIYCEICHKDYDDFETHLNYKKHSEFLANNENFNELIGVINSLPPFIKKSSIILSSSSSSLMIEDENTVENSSQSSSLNPPMNDGKTLADLTNKPLMVRNDESIAENNSNNVNNKSPELSNYHHHQSKLLEMAKNKTKTPPITKLHSINTKTWSSATKTRGLLVIHDLLTQNNNSSHNQSQTQQSVRNENEQLIDSMNQSI